MNQLRIADLLQPFLGPSTNPVIASELCHSDTAKAGGKPAFLAPFQLQCISTYIDILVRWNARINLTAIRDPEEIVRRHFGESLFAARHLYPQPCLKSARTDAPGSPAEPTSTDLGSTDLGSTDLSSTDLSS